MGQPKNINFLSQMGFRLSIRRLPSVEYFIQTINLPGITLGTANQPTMFATVPYSGDLVFNDLTITFKIDEELQNYLEIWNWITGLGFPHDFGQYKALETQNQALNPVKGELYSDMSLMILDNQQVPKFEVKFEDAFPVNISDIQFGSIDPTINYITATTVFKYTLYTINKI